jgi:predicted RNA-binding protein with TRAM domain
LDDLPVKLGQEYTVDIIDVTPNGEGIAKVQSFSVFIPGAKLNEKLTVRITRLDSAGADAQRVS